MTVEEGAKTQLQKGQASAEARLDLLEQADLAQRIAALEALAGLDADATTAFWDSTNMRWLIASITITLLALLGWNADDIRSFIP